MSVTSWDVMMERLYQNCMDSPKDAEEFCIGCWFPELIPGDDINPAEWVCPWEFNPNNCPREDEFKDACGG